MSVSYAQLSNSCRNALVAVNELIALAYKQPQAKKGDIHDKVARQEHRNELSDKSTTAFATGRAGAKI